jgi:HSP20 family protein
MVCRLHLGIQTIKTKIMYTKRNYSAWPNNFGGLMEDVLHNGINRLSQEMTATTVPVNIRETDKTYELHVVAAGLSKEEFKLKVDGDLLHISYEHKPEPEGQPQDGKWLRNEYKKRSFKRSFTLTDKVDATNISAKYTDGVLVIALPKKEPAAPTAQEIKID